MRSHSAHSKRAQSAASMRPSSRASTSVSTALTHSTDELNFLKNKLYITAAEDHGMALPRPMSAGMLYAARVADFDLLSERDVWRVPDDEKAFLTEKAVQRIYAAKCQDQQCGHNDERQARFQDLLSQQCKGQWFVMRQCGLGPAASAAVCSVLFNNAHYTHLDLSGNNVQEEGGQALGALMQQNTAIIVLRLQSANLGEGIHGLAAGLMDNRHLTTLDLSGIPGMRRNSVGRRAAASLANMLRSNVVLSTLKVGCCGMQQNSQALLRGCGHHAALTHLDLSGNTIRDESCDAVAQLLLQGLCALEIIDLTLNAISCKGIGKICQGLCQSGKRGSGSSLKTLLLAENNIGYYGCKAIADLLAENHTLTHLDLSRNNLSRVALGEDGLPTVDNINGIGEVFTQMETTAAPIAVLKLPNCSMTTMPRSLISMLGQTTSLKFLDLSENPFGDEGAEIIGFGLSKNRSLEQFSMVYNKVTTAGGVFLANGLRDHPTLKKIKINQGTRMDTVKAGFLDAVRHNSTMKAIDLPKFVADDVKPMLRRNHLMALRSAAPQLEEKRKALQEEEQELYNVHDMIAEEHKRRERLSEVVKVAREKHKAATNSFKAELQGLEEQLNRLKSVVTNLLRQRMSAEDSEETHRRNRDAEKSRFDRRIENQQHAKQDAMALKVKVEAKVKAAIVEQSTGATTPRSRERQDELKQLLTELDVALERRKEAKEDAERQKAQLEALERRLEGGPGVSGGTTPMDRSARRPQSGAKGDRRKSSVAPKKGKSQKDLRR